MKRLLLPLLAALALPTAIQAEDKLPFRKWVKTDAVLGLEERFLGCIRGICQKETRLLNDEKTEIKFYQHTNYDCKNFRTIDSLPVSRRTEKDYQKYVWEYPIIGSKGHQDLEKVCLRKDGYDFKE